MKKLYILLIIILISACEKEGDSSNTALQPGEAIQISPAQNELCTSGVNISQTQSRITFEWEEADNADHYELHIKNLTTLESKVYSTAEKTTEITLNRNTPYSWYVVSQSNGTSLTAESDVWKFYNSGPGAISYAPFPAGIVAPLLAQNVTANAGKVTLTWTGSDVDNDISSYEVFFGTSTPVSKGIVTESKLDVDVSSNTIYNWKIITKDKQGNASDSGIYWFKVN